MGGILVAGALALVGGTADIVRRAAGIGETSSGLEGFVRTADALITPVMVAMAAIAPLALIAGAGALMVGSRKGGMMMISAIGALVIVASAKGIIA